MHQTVLTLNLNSGILQFLIAGQEADDARQNMAVGELGYWPSGSAFCIFFGPTPVSEGETPRAYSNVNPFGQVEGDATVFEDVEDGENVTVSRLER